jgi:hypothetical protein
MEMLRLIVLGLLLESVLLWSESCRLRQKLEQAEAKLARVELRLVVRKSERVDREET